MRQERCPVCAASVNADPHSRERIRRELDIRRRFVARRFRYKPHQSELMDLTEFMHGGPAELRVCRNCGTMTRSDDSHADYAHDVYDPALLRHLYPRYREAFRTKEPHYRKLLSPHADVVELGSHLGAFLENAEEWGWRPTGLDIGEDTRAFAMRQGLTVRRESLEDTRLKAHSAEALFIWNCFEQLGTPGTVLQHAHELLRRHGLLVVRVPNADFYQHRQRTLHEARLRSLREQALHALAYNNLLGFPYEIGYNSVTLTRVLTLSGFQVLSGVDAGLLTAPYPELTPLVEREARRALDRYAGGPTRTTTTLAGPWIEIAARLRN